MENRYKFNEGTELNNDLGIVTYETAFRGYDAQIGRFGQIDPMADKYNEWSPYTFAFNDPIYWNDPLGADPNPGDLQALIDALLAGNGGTITPDGNGGWNSTKYGSSEQAFTAFSLYMDRFNAWGQNGNPGFASFQAMFYEMFGSYIQHQVVVKGNYNKNGNWVTTNEAEVQAQLRRNGGYWNGGSSSSFDVSTSGLEFIAKYEGFSSSVYKDVAGLRTIGYGHLIKTGEVYSHITKAQAIELLRSDASKAVKVVNTSVKVPLTQSQFDALVSFSFNVGNGAFMKSSLLRNINSGNSSSIESSFLKWNKARVGGVLQPVKGLTNRRQAEADLFLDGTY